MLDKKHNEAIIEQLSLALKTSDNPQGILINKRTFKITIEAEKVIISMHASFQLDETESEILNTSLNHLMKSGSPTFRRWYESYLQHMEIKFDINQLNMEVLRAQSNASLSAINTFSIRHTKAINKSSNPFETLFRESSELQINSYDPSEECQPTYPPKNPVTLNQELITLFLQDDMPHMPKVRELLEQGASPIERIEVTFPPEIKRKTGVHTALHEALMQWTYQHMFQLGTPLDKMGELLKAYAIEKPIIGKIELSGNREATYKHLFGEQPHHVIDKISALRSVLTDCALLLSDPENCLDFFKTVDSKLTSYWLESTGSSSLPRLNNKTYDIKCHDGLRYPVAKDGYTQHCFVKKNSAVQRVLFKMWSDAGLVKIPPQKWLEFVPAAKTIEYLRKFVFFVEDTANPTGLLHGKISHNLQRLIILDGIKKGLIRMDFGDITVTAEELFSALMDPRFKLEKKFLWQTMFDQRNLTGVTFSDPHMLHSYLMTSENRTEFQFLSDCMIHSFCNGMLKMAKIMNTCLYETSWTAALVWDKILSCMQTELFFDFKPNFNLQVKNNWFGKAIVAKGPNFAILHKNYGQQNPATISKPLAEPKTEIHSEEDYFDFINQGLSQTSTPFPLNAVEIIHQYNDTAGVYEALLSQGIFTPGRTTMKTKVEENLENVVRLHV